MSGSQSAGSFSRFAIERLFAPEATVPRRQAARQGRCPAYATGATVAAMDAEHLPPTFDDDTLDLDPPGARRLLAVTFHGRPGTANVTRSDTTRKWMDQVRSQAAGLLTQWERDMRF